MLLCPCNFPEKNTGVGCHFLLQGIFKTQGSNLHLLRLNWQVDSLPLHLQGSPSQWRALGIPSWRGRWGSDHRGPKYHAKNSAPDFRGNKRSTESFLVEDFTHMWFKKSILTGSISNGCCLVTKSCPALLQSHGPHQVPLSMGFSQARILEWKAISFSRASSRSRDWTHISCIADGFFTTEPPGKLISNGEVFKINVVFQWWKRIIKLVF